MTISVLLVEDHQIVREGTRQLLTQWNDIKVTGEAEDGLDALAQAEILQPDVIVMDVRLPKMNGIEATRLIANKMPNCKILILSAYDDDSYVFPLLEAGASGYLLKSSSGSELAEAIRSIMNGGTVLSPSIGTKLIHHLGISEKKPGRDSSKNLTNRELEVLKSVARGQSNKIIAKELGISIQTVQVHMRNIFSKLQIRSRSEALIYAVNNGLVIVEKDHEK